MRYAIIADIHANLAAFTEVLIDIERRDEADELWCLGDIMGYGPDPHECITLLRQANHVCVAGNHDLAAIGKADTSDFDSDTAIACQWTAKQLTYDDIVYLRKLPQVIQKDDFTLVHGSPREPALEYLLSTSIAQENFAHFKTPYCLVGHTHIPQVFRHDESGAYSANEFSPKIGLVMGKSRMIINPGSVGQPLDGDPRASYAIYDSETRMTRLYRVPYDIKATQARMVKNNLPMRLVARLNAGQ